MVLMVIALDSDASGPGSSLFGDTVLCRVFLGNNKFSHKIYVGGIENISENLDVDLEHLSPGSGSSSGLSVSPLGSQEEGVTSPDW